MTPKIVADEAKKALEPLGVTVNAYEKEWIEAEQMGSFLSVSHGSKQDPIFLEIFYNGSDTTAAPFVIAGEMNQQLVVPLNECGTINIQNSIY